LHVDCRGLESALEAVRVSVEAVRVSLEALRCLRGCEKLEEVPENVNSSRGCKKNCLKKFWNILVLFQSF
jgi:hypothetical protein